MKWNHRAMRLLLCSVVMCCESVTGAKVMAQAPLGEGEFSRLRRDLVAAVDARRDAAAVEGLRNSLLIQCRKDYEKSPAFPLRLDGLIREMRSGPPEQTRAALAEFRRLDWATAGAVIHYLGNDVRLVREMACRMWTGSTCIPFMAELDEVREQSRLIRRFYSDFERSLLAAEDAPVEAEMLLPDLTARAVIQGPLWRVTLTVSLRKCQFDGTVVKAAEHFQDEGPRLVGSLTKQDWKERREALTRSPRLLSPRGGLDASAPSPRYARRYLRDCLQRLPIAEQQRALETIDLIETPMVEGLFTSHHSGLIYPPGESEFARWMWQVLTDPRGDVLTQYQMAKFLVAFKGGMGSIISRSGEKSPLGALYQDVSSALKEEDSRAGPLLALAMATARYPGAQEDGRVLSSALCSGMERCEEPYLRFQMLLALEKLSGKTFFYDPFSDETARKAQVRAIRKVTGTGE